MSKAKIFEITDETDKEELYEITKKCLSDYGWTVSRDDNSFLVTIPTDEESISLQFATVFELNAFSAGIGIGLLMVSPEEQEEDSDESDNVEFTFES